MVLAKLFSMCVVLAGIFIGFVLYKEELQSIHMCHAVSKKAHKFMGTKTSYQYVKNIDAEQFVYIGCEPHKAWLIVRHGSRNPSRELIMRMRQDLPRIRDEILSSHNSLCAPDIDALRSWRPQIEEGDAKRLSPSGEDEMIELAERFKIRFPKLFPNEFRNDSFKFKYTATQRTQQSARYFTMGLFGRKKSREVFFPEPLQKDPVLRFYKLCRRWKVEVDKNPCALEERNKFEWGPEVKTVLKNITRRLGLKHQITIEEMGLVYKTCAYESSWNWPQVSPWCSVFTEEDLEVLEYCEDLEYYWIDGYGYEITYKQACPAIKDMMGHVLSPEETSPKTVVYFTHSGTILKMLTHLGLYKDSERLNHDNFNLSKSRKWKVSQIDAFGSNIAFVHFKCIGGNEKLLTLHQERFVTLPGCPLYDLCDMDTVMKYLSNSISNCNFDEMCDN